MIHKVILLIILINEALTASVRIDPPENGIIESYYNTSLGKKVYSIKCNKNSQLNSNSPLVYQSNVNQTIKWVPVYGYLYANLPLCLRLCRFQFVIINGLIKIETLMDLKNSNNHSLYIDLIESSKINYECSDGYYLRETSNNKNFKERKYLSEKCQSNGIEEYVVVKRKSSKSKVPIRQPDEYKNNIVEYYDSNSDEQYDEYYLDNLDTDLSSISSLTSFDDRKVYQCVRNCKPFKTNSIKNGYLVPSNSNIQFSPGERVNYYCKEGYLTDLTKTTKHKSNMYILECTTNGTWNLKSPILLNENIEHLTECTPINSYKTNEFKKSDSYLTYSELNMRTFTMIFAICGLIILVLLTSLLTLKLLKRKHTDLVFNNLSPQLDPLLTNNNDANSTLPEYTLRSRTNISTIATSSNLSTSELPTYQEAISQPTFLPTNQSILISSNTDRVNNLNEQANKEEQRQQQQSNQQRSNQQWESGMARSGSIRSNLTTRSANGSIRTTNSIATTHSVGNASFNIPLPHRSVRSASKHNQTNRSTSKRHTNNNNSSNNNNKTTRSTNSAISEACTVLTATNISLMSNETNASVKALRGSSSGVDLVSNNSAGSSISVNQNTNQNTNNTKIDSEILVIDESNFNNDQNPTN